MTAIYVINHSTVVTAAEAMAMTRACATQVGQHAAPWWGRSPIAVVNVLPGQPAAPGAWVLAILDDPDQADALGWHTENQGDVVYGRVFAKPVLANGGGVLSGSLSVSSVLSHEVLETLINPHVNMWAQAGDGMLWACEVGDPVENDSYPVNGVMVSNFVTPHFFDPQAGKERLDWLGRCVGPFQMTKGGYAVVMAPGGQPQQVFGADFPAWKKPLKAFDGGRSARLVAPRLKVVGVAAEA